MKARIRAGFTNIEVIVAVGIMLILFGLSSVSIVGINQKASLNTTVDSLLVDFQDQQLKAMVGETEGRTTHDSYGIHFETDSYTLFHGATYNSSDAANVVIPITGGVTFTSVSFPSSQIIFSSVSGEVANFTAGSNAFTLRNTTSGKQKTITVNRYGVISSIQ